MEIEIGRGKKARRAYGFDDIAIVPSRRTRDAEDVDIGWRLGPYLLELPLLASAMDGVVSPRSQYQLGKLGGLGVLNLEGIWTRYEDADEQLERIAKSTKGEATKRMQQIYAEPVKPELIAQRIHEIKAAGVLAAASLTPQRVREYSGIALDAGLDMLVIQGTVVSAEHVSTVVEPLNLKEFIASSPIPTIVGGCASYQTALHLMRTGAAGVLVGVGPGAACTTRGVLGVGVPQATAIADAAAARIQHLLETGQYVQRHRRRRHAHRRRHLQGDRLRRRRRHDRLAARAARPRRPAAATTGAWRPSTPTLPRGTRVKTEQVADARGDRGRAGDRERRHD